ncbi:MAG: hypothetical protein JXR37_28465 [Kiritimatiellae bacterium]|nr:hypothetical protein [Kiritimatiellia bacterium]
MKHIVRAVVAILVRLSVAASAAEPDYGLNFEDEADLQVLRAEQSVIRLSSRRYKAGRRSLEWQWRAGARLRVSGPNAAGLLAKEGGVKFWYYNEDPTREKLTFTVSAAGADLYRFQAGLAFTGWRAAWVRLRPDAEPLADPPANAAAPVVLTVAGPSVGAGRIYFDMLDLTDYVPGSRTRDYQTPFVKGNERSHWHAAYELSCIEPPPAEPGLSEAERVELATITRRCDEWLLGSARIPREHSYVKTAYAHIRKQIEAARKSFQELAIRCENGVYTGTGLFAHRSEFQPRITEAFSKAPLALAYDYRLNGNAQSARDYVTFLNFCHDQGWAEGSGMETMAYNSLGTGGYFYSVFLMRQVLRRAGIFEREFATMRWHSYFNGCYREPEWPGANADVMRTEILTRLLAVLVLDDTPEKARDMRCLARWQNNACRVATGWADTIKPDFTGFHHGGFYASAYAPSGVKLGAAAAYLQRGTRYALDATSLCNLKQSVFVREITANLYEIPPSIAGRFPFSHNALGMYEPMAYLAAAMKDRDVTRRLKRFWQAMPMGKRESACRVGGDGWISRPPGFVELLVGLLDSSVPPAALPPQGNWNLPYGAVMVQRRDRWMALAKGYNRYVWDAEIYWRNGENVFGQYLSYGTVFLYCAGEPVVSAVGSGYDPRGGLDWSLLPGATNPMSPLDALRQKKRSCLLNGSTFAAGVSNGRDGVFGLDLRSGHREGFTLRARKSVFMKDNVLVFLGSAITGKAEYPVVTTLFQTRMKAADQPTTLNGESLTRFPCLEQVRGPASLSDAVGNRYLLPAGQSATLRRSYQISAHSSDRPYRKSEGNTIVAWLDHGKQPRDASYHYAVLVQPRGGGQRSSYKLLRHDEHAHIVEFPGVWTGYSLFKAGKVGVGPIVEVDQPCLVMVEPCDGGMRVSLTNPDLNFEMPAGERYPSYIYEPRSIAGWHAPSRFTPVRATLEGGWRVRSGAGRVVTGDAQATTIEFPCIDARSFSVALAAHGP